MTSRDTEEPSSDQKDHDPDLCHHFGSHSRLDSRRLVWLRIMNQVLLPSKSLFRGRASFLSAFPHIPTLRAVPANEKPSGNFSSLGRKSPLGLEAFLRREFSISRCDELVDSFRSKVKGSVE
ncbi:unnamed protein product [Cyprideis torosa]|uniref:Uncharacterized protein n=1 Tax=Cyprideis torosa TaxID=163714 RepID=A0A7R8ZPG7_9CRUS|nr:unnamed protein product [Cyprideis torosa]CAG0898835.1 unnamed protein product [Cyprideis torosa]